MKRFRTSTLGAAALATLMLSPGAALAVSEHHQAGAAAAVESRTEGPRLAHMRGGTPGMRAPAQGYGAGPCPYGMGPGMMGPGMMQGMGPGMMGPGMMGQGMGPGMMGPGTMGPGMMGQGMNPGMMGPGMMGPGMMGPGMMGPGMMGPGMMRGMGSGMMGPGPGYGMMPDATPGAGLSADDVRARLQRSLEWHGNPRLEVGDVTEADDDTITADIVTKDDSLVQRFMVDRHTGAMRPAQ